MSHDSTSDTMQAYLNTLLGGGTVSVSKLEKEGDCSEVDSRSSTLEQKEKSLSVDANGSKVNGCDQPPAQQTQLNHDTTALSGDDQALPSVSQGHTSTVSKSAMASLDRSVSHSVHFSPLDNDTKHVEGSISPVFNSPLTRKTENRSSFVNESSATETRSTVSNSPKDKQQRQLAAKTGSGRPIVPRLEETDALREEQKARLQKLLTPQQLKIKSKQAVAQPEAKIEQAIAEEFKGAVAEERKADSKQELEVSDTLPETQVDPELDKNLDGTFHSELAQTCEWHSNGRPHWGQERFDALLFDVAGLTLAVPLVALGQIVRYEKEELTPIFGQTDWFMGLLESNVGRLRVINTALFVMPEKYDQRFLDSAEYAISLDGVKWALAVDRVNQPISLDPDEIKWRTERSKRPWLAGTVKSQMCALIDIPQMANLLNESDKTLSHQ